MVSLKVNCTAWSRDRIEGTGVCSKGHSGGHPTVNFCAARCPVGDRQPLDLTDRRVILIEAEETEPIRLTKRPPDDWDVRGPGMWKELHHWPFQGSLSTTPMWLADFERRIGCNECRTHWRRWIQAHPPDFSAREALFTWTVAAHNEVNRRLGRPTMSIASALAQWKEIVINETSKQEGPLALAPECRHAEPTADPFYVRCALGLYGGEPHVTICRRCPRRIAAETDRAEQSIARRNVPNNNEEPGSKNPNGVNFERGRRLKVDRLLLKTHLSPGDIVMLTAAVRDLHRAYPGRFVTAVDTSAAELWKYNPLVVPHDPLAGEWRTVEMHYPLINQSNQRPVHFLYGYAEYLSKQLGLPIPVTEFKGDIYLSEEEKRWMNQVQEQFGYGGRFWILMAGGKYDFTAKWWPPRFYQQVVDHFLGKVQFVQCGESNHWHPPLNGVFDLIGQTSTRQFIRLIHHAEGVICPVTFAMHLAAAVPTRDRRLRPCVVIAGGREPPHWEAYPGHQFLHTVGALSCCATGGCWKSRCQPVGDESRSVQHQNVCERPVQVEPHLRIPQCMVMIQPADVISAVERSLSYRG